MRILLAIIGYIVGVILGIALLAMIGSDMSSSFIVGNVGGIILALVGYNYPKSEEVEK